MENNIDQQLREDEALREKYIKERFENKWQLPGFRDAVIHFYETGDAGMRLRNALADMMIDYHKVAKYNPELSEAKDIVTRRDLTIVSLTDTVNKLEGEVQHCLTVKHDEGLIYQKEIERLKGEVDYWVKAHAEERDRCNSIAKLYNSSLNSNH